MDLTVENCPTVHGGEVAIEHVYLVGGKKQFRKVEAKVKETKTKLLYIECSKILYSNIRTRILKL